MRTRIALSALVAAVCGASLAIAQESEKVTLRELVAAALERNPELPRARRGIDALEAKVAPAGALPDPELMFGQMNEGSVLPFTTLGEPDAGFSEIYLGVTQELPFPGKRSLRRKIAETEARAEEPRYRALRLRIASEVKSAFYDLYAVRKSIDIVSKERTLLDQLARIASARYGVGKGIQQDVLDAEVEISKTEERLSVLTSRRESTEALLNTLLNRPVATPIAELAGIEKQPLGRSLAELTALAAEHYPELESSKRQIEREQLALELARKGKYPDFGVTFVYHNRGSNRPYWTIGATARIPLYFARKQRGEIEEAAAAVSGSRHAYASTRNRLFYEVKNAYLMASTAERLVRLYDEGIIRQASFSLESAVENYQVGKIDFTTLLASWTRVLDYEIGYYEQLAGFHKALAQLEPLVGIELTRP